MFEELIGVSFNDRSISDVMGLKDELEKELKRASFLGKHKDYGRKKQSFIIAIQQILQLAQACSRQP